MQAKINEEASVEVVVKGRHCEVSDRFRAQVEEKLTRLEKYHHRIIRVDVEVSKESNPRLSDQSTRVEITMRSKGPIIRAEAAADEKLTALDKAVERLGVQLRKAADRRRVHHGTRTPASLAQALAGHEAVVESADGNADDLAEHKVGPLTVLGDGPLVVRQKTHPGVPIPLDQALYEMELVGHDFYLFMDKEDDRPAVVYRRKGYDYGVIKLTQ
ncbi:MAG TPA: ribosome-associated translation inhibitor RaiA [Acidimicrobiales bacterium]